MARYTYIVKAFVECETIIVVDTDDGPAVADDEACCLAKETTIGRLWRPLSKVEGASRDCTIETELVTVDTYVRNIE